MYNSLSFLTIKRSVIYILIDFVALLVIYFIPAISHSLMFPVYYIEPMRLMLIIALIHTPKENAYFIAISLPIFSFFFSGHPSLFKICLIAPELLLNVWLFLFLSGKNKNSFISMLLSIILSKLFYYTFKFLFIEFSFLQGRIISTPILIQIMIIIIYSLYAYILNNRFEKFSV